VTRVIHLSAVALLLAGVLRFYDSPNGFTALISFGERYSASVVPALRDLPHRVSSHSEGYDGQFYAQMALDPLLRDPATDRAQDEPALRARRILFSWTAYLLGLGRPAWILQAFALQNVLSWLLLGVLLRRWFDLETPRGIALWLVTVFSAGLLWSIRRALLDGPSLLILALAVASIEKGRQWTAAILCGLAGLARETNTLAVFALLDPWTWTTRRSVARAAGLVAVALAPLAIWFDYIHSIYRSRIFTSGETLAFPFAGFLWRAGVASKQILAGAVGRDLPTIVIVLAFVTQIGWLVARPRWRDPWWRIGIAFAALFPFLGQPLWAGTLPTVVRVELPLLLAFNVGLLHVKRAGLFWTLLACGNATLLLEPLLRIF
jgi:hypothetical protein